MNVFKKLSVVKDLLRELWRMLDGKKTVAGASTLLFWIVFYALPAFHPEYNWITHYSTQVRDFLLANGIQLDNATFNSGVLFTVLGLLDKFKKNVKPSSEPGKDA